jgi:hypothetical protein
LARRHSHCGEKPAVGCRSAVRWPGCCPAARTLYAVAVPSRESFIGWSGGRSPVVCSRGPPLEQLPAHPLDSSRPRLRLRRCRSVHHSRLDVMTQSVTAGIQGTCGQMTAFTSLQCPSNFPAESDIWFNLLKHFPLFD